MKVKVTVSGVMEMEQMDVKLLKKAGANAVVDTMKFQCATMDVKIESVKAQKAKKEVAPEEPEASVETKTEEV